MCKIPLTGGTEGSADDGVDSGVLVSIGHHSSVVLSTQVSLVRRYAVD